MLRMLVLFGVLRLWKDRGSARCWRILSGGVNRLDISIIIMASFIALNGVLLFREFGALNYQLGNLYTTFGVYFLLRYFIRDEDDVVLFIRTVAFVAIFIAGVMSWEFLTGHNPYSILNGARSSFYATLMERDDRFRATGCFAHPILAGTFGAVTIPLFVLLWWRGKGNRALAATAMVASTVIVLTCNSSTPILAFGGGVLALCLWPVRGWMRPLRWAIVTTLVSLHIVMKAPVWHLISRIDISGGSSSYHRYMLVDQCIRHFTDWCLLGVKSTADWGWDMWDTCNQYVGTADTSGLIPFIALIAAIIYGFKFVGRARKRSGMSNRQRLTMWALGAALFANVVAFFGIGYFDQSIVPWYGLLAAICTTQIEVSKNADFGERIGEVSSLALSRRGEFNSKEEPQPVWLSE